MRMLIKILVEHLNPLWVGFATCISILTFPCISQLIVNKEYCYALCELYCFVFMINTLLRWHSPLSQYYYTVCPWGSNIAAQWLLFLPLLKFPFQFQGFHLLIQDLAKVASETKIEEIETKVGFLFLNVILTCVRECIKGYAIDHIIF